MTTNPAEFSPIITSIFKTVYDANQIIDCFEEMGLIVESDKENEKYIGNFIFNILSEQSKMLFDTLGLPDNISVDDKDDIQMLIDTVLSYTKTDDFADNNIIKAKYECLIERINNDQFKGDKTC